MAPSLLLLHFGQFLIQSLLEIINIEELKGGKVDAFL